jgi:hypothetical protein
MKLKRASLENFRSRSAMAAFILARGLKNRKGAKRAFFSAQAV